MDRPGSTRLEGRGSAGDGQYGALLPGEESLGYLAVGPLARNAPSGPCRSHDPEQSVGRRFPAIHQNVGRRAGVVTH